MSDKSKKRRLENTTVACPVVFGSIAFWMGKKAEEHATHRWTLFVRGPNDEDLGCFVSKVIFSLHPSFAAPLREITSPPFEVTELGWGEFEAGIRIFFKDPDEKPVDILHMIRLHPEGASQSVCKKPVVMEYYDEVVFTNPSPSFRAQLMQYTPPVPRPITWFTEYHTVFNEEVDLQKLMAVQDYLAQQLDAAKAQLLRQEAELGLLQAVPAPQSSLAAQQYSGSAAFQQLQAGVQPTPTAAVALQQQQQQAPPVASSSAPTAPPSAAAPPKKKEGKAERAEREKAEREKAEKDRAAAAKKRAASAKAKKEKAEKALKDKDKAKAAPPPTSTAATVAVPAVTTTVLAATVNVPAATKIVPAVTATVPAATVVTTVPAATVTTTVPAATVTTTVPAATATTTVPAATVVTTVPAATVVTTVPAATVTTTVPAATATNTVPAATVTTTVPTAAVTTTVPAATATTSVLAATVIVPGAATISSINASTGTGIGAVLPASALPKHSQ